MRIPSKSDPEDSGQPEDIPTEVQIWLSKGWTIIPSERRGFVLQGQIKMSALDKVGLMLGAVLLVGFPLGHKLPGVLGVILLIGAWLDYKFNTKPPTKFFPAPGEQSRTLER